MDFSEAWGQARARSAESAPRRAAIRSAFDATRAVPGLKDREPDEIRARLVTELTGRGVSGCSEQTMTVMVQAIQTSRVQVTAHLLARGARTAWAAWQSMRDHRIPGWLNPPGNAERVPGEQVRRVVAAHVLLDPASPELLTRLVREVPKPVQAPDEPDDELPSFMCWLTLDSAGPRNRVQVHAGSHLLGFLPDEVADELRPQLAALAARRKSLEVEAVLHGDGPLTAAVEVFLPLTHG